MHILHYIAVEAENAQDAIYDAEAALESYGDGQVWDWYQVGGRWDGVLAGDNVLQFSSNPSEFRKALADAKASRLEQFTSNLAKLNGTRVTAGDVSDYFMGLPVTEKSEVAERQTIRNREVSAEFQSLLQLKELPEARSLSTLGYYLRLISDELLDYYPFASLFFDYVGYRSTMGPTLERCETNPDNQWIVAVDLHN